MRSKIRNLFQIILSNRVFSKLFSEKKKYGQIFSRVRRFLLYFPWWNHFIVNWGELFLIFLNIKKSSNIYFKDGFVYKNCNKKNWHFLTYYFRYVWEHNFPLKNKNDKIAVQVDKYYIELEHDWEGVGLIDEIFVRKEYGKFDYNDKIVMDIGGFIGCSAVYFVLEGAKKVLVFELIKEAFEILEENIRFNKLENKIKVFNQGISSKHEEKIMYITRYKSRSGVFNFHYDPIKLKEKRIVNLIPFNEVLKDPIDILKVDCEGCEYDIFENIMEYNLIDKIREGVILEVHFVNEQRNPEYLKSLLKKIGFKKIYSDNQMIWAYK